MATDSQSKDKSIDNVLLAVEQKPHYLYIRYLLTKKWGPSRIRDSLQRFGLSCPVDDALIKYYQYFIRPTIGKYNLGHLYQDYDHSVNQRETRKNARFPQTDLKFKLDVYPIYDTQVNFLRALNELGVTDMWNREILGVYVKRENIPTDPDTGEVLMRFHVRTSFPYNIMESAHRHVIDEMILGDMNNTEITRRCLDSFNLKIDANEVQLYRHHFLNLQTLDTERQIKVLTVEQKNIENCIRNVDIRIGKADSGQSDEAMADLLLEKRQLAIRAQDLSKTIKQIQAQHTEHAVASKELEKMTYKAIFEEMFEKSYEKFKSIASQNDRASVDPMLKITNMMKSQYEMLDKVKNNEADNAMNTKANLVRIISERDEEYKDELKTDEELLSEHDYTGRPEEEDLSTIMGVDNLNDGNVEVVDTGDEEDE